MTYPPPPAGAPPPGPPRAQEPAKVMQIAIVHFIIAIVSLFVAPAIMWTAWMVLGTIITLITFGLGFVVFCCPVIIQLWLVATAVLNGIAGIGLVATKDPKFAKLSKIAMVFAFVNIIGFDIISLILGIVLVVMSKDEEYQRWVESAR
jgi:hypothetical protein